MTERQHMKLSVAEMKQLLSAKDPPLALLRSLLSELKHRDTAAALRLKDRIESDIRNRAEGRSSDGPKHDKTTDQRSSQDNLRYDALMNDFKNLQSQLKTCSDREARLAAEVTQLRARASPNDALFNRVYMTSNSPRWLVLDVQRAFRVRYHPDRHENTDKRTKAEEIFQQAEQVFAKLLQLKT